MRDVLGRCNLGSQRGLGDRRGDHVGREAQIARLEGESLVLGLRVERFDLATDAAERIERIRHVHAGAVQRVVDTTRCSADQTPRRAPCALRFVGAGDAREQSAALCGDGFVGLPQGRLRGLERRAVGERALDQLVERRGLKQGPPLSGNVQAVDEALRFAAGQRRGCSRGGQPTRGHEGPAGGRLGRLEVRSHRAAAPARR